MRMRSLAPLLLLPLLLLPLLLLPVLAQAQMYRWVDDSGKLHYSDRPPASGAKNVQKRSLPAAQGSAAPLPYALQQAARNFPVTLYVSADCGQTCEQARQLLNQRGVPYREISVADEAGLAQLKKLSGGNAVPVMTVGREVHAGFDGGAYKAALDGAAYPASSQLPPGVQARQPVAKPAQKTAAAEGKAEGKGEAGAEGEGKAEAGAEGEGKAATAPQEAAPQGTADTAAPK